MTIREAVKRTSGPISRTLSRIVEAYNNAIHRGIGMKPVEAVKPENINAVVQHQEIYSKEFKQQKHAKKSFKPNEGVLIRNEKRTSKMDDVFKEQGIIKCSKGNGVYQVKLNNGKVITRHESQLRSFKRGDVVDDANISS